MRKPLSNNLIDPTAPLGKAVRWMIVAANVAAAVTATARVARAQEAPAPAAAAPVGPASAAPAPAPEPANVPAKAQAPGMIENGLDENGRISLTVNRTVVVTTRRPVTDVSMSANEVADVQVVSANTVLITAKKAGSTNLLLMDGQNQSQSVDIVVRSDIQALKDELKKTFPDYNVEVAQLQDGIALKGRVPNLQIAEQMTALATPFGKVLNLLEVAGGQQVMLQVQFVEMSRLASSELGFRGAIGGNGFRAGTNFGPGASNVLGLANGDPDTTLSDAVSLFAAGKVGDIALEGFLRALKANNLARTLAEPNLVAISGEPASFLAGGEIPIPVPQAGAGGASTITIEYKEFGVRLNYVAVVLGDGRIKLNVKQEVSDLDYSRAVQFAGGTVPAIATRRAESTVELQEGQTMALAGLLQRKVNASSNKTPLLGDLPVVGALFRSVRYERQETELVILVKPVLVKAMNPDQVPQGPGANWRYPNEAQLYGSADIGGPTGPANAPANPPATAPAPRYIGQQGFGDENASAALGNPVLGGPVPITPPTARH